jgi:hypothetical protein
VDFDGSRELASGKPAVVGRPTAPLRLPGTGRALPYACFPAVPPAGGYGNGSQAERTNHPLLYNPFRPAAPDRAFTLADLEAPLRYGDKGSPALSSDLFRLSPRFFGDAADPAGSDRRRRLVTLASFDPDRPGVSPWFWTQSQRDAAYNRLPPLDPIPTLSPHASGGAVAPPPGLTAQLESEFGPDGRTAAALTALRRLDLNRYLPDYPNPDPQTGRITDLTGFLVAQTARQHMAAEIFEVLWRVTGAGDPAQAPPPGSSAYEPARWDALRGLAQMAVNIVDFVDTDDLMTPFFWYTDARTGRKEVVYGTELPRVVLNEVYAEYTNDPGDPGLLDRPPQARRFKGNVWVELYNPFRDDPPLTAPHRAGAARLEVPATAGQPAYAPYRLILAWLRTDLRQPDNVRGEIPPGGGPVLSVLSGFSPDPAAPPRPGVDPRWLLPADPARAGGYSGPPGGNQGFYVLGPALSDAERSPFAPAAGRPMETLRRSEMSYFTQASYPDLLPKPSVLWQRLACPHLPPQPDPLSPYHNPYITVDYVRDVPPNYAAAVGVGTLAPAVRPAPERASVGRKQPYAAHASQLKRQQPNPAYPDQPQHTFFQHNADATTPGPNLGLPPRDYPPFDWLLHLDRQLVSPGELLHVSAFKPHELTQQFRTGDADRQKFTHRAPWLDEDLAGSSVPQSHRLYRALEFLGTRSRILGMMEAATTAAEGLPPAEGAPPLLYPDQKVSPAAMSGTTASGGTWWIEVGASLVIDRGQSSEEVVRVKAVGPATSPSWFVADFLRPHGPGFTIAPVTISERVPGKINLNTVWDEEVFLALCDANPSSGFKEGAVRAAFERLRDSRTVTGEAPGPGDRPLLSLAAGLTPAGGGLQDTLLRTHDLDAADRLPILAVPGRPHPQQTYELLTKIFNNTTVRSNVFAVWVTVGFFEVTDENTRPVKLGAEIGRAELRHLRHRMFAIVDRSVLTANPGPQPRFELRGPIPAFANCPVVPYFSIID